MGAAARWRLAWPLALCVGVALRFLLDRSPGTDAAAVGLPLDDGWIHLVYARSLAGFDGFAYVPGQAEAGFTSPLWAILLAPLFWIRVPWDVSLVLIVKVVGVACAAAASVFGFRLGERLAGIGAGMVLGTMIALDPWLAFGAVSGMEVPLAAATSLAAFDLLCAKRYRGAGIALALAVLSRPEMLVVAVTAVAVFAWLDRDELRSSATFRALALPPLAVTVAWVGYCLIVTGRLLPSAFYLKHQDAGPLDAFSDAGTVIFGQLLDYPWLFWGCGVVAFVLGAHRLLVEGEGAKARAARLALVLVGPLWIVAIIWAHRINEPLAFYWHRYLDAGIALVFVPIAIGLWTSIDELFRLVRRRPARQTQGRVLGALAVPLIAMSLVTLPAKIDRNASLQAWSAENVEEEQVQVGLWIANNSSPNDWIATHDAGAIRFISDRPVVDMLGINTHEALGGGLPEVLRAHPPRYLAIIPSWYPSMLHDPRLREVYEVHVDHFVICSKCQQDEMVVLRPASAAPTAELTPLAARRAPRGATTRNRR